MTANLGREAIESALGKYAAEVVILHIGKTWVIEYPRFTEVYEDLQDAVADAKQYRLDEES